MTTYSHIAKALASSGVSHKDAYEVMENFAKEHHLSEDLQQIAATEMETVYRNVSGLNSEI